jgi:hypothetical protein
MIRKRVDLRWIEIINSSKNAYLRRQYIVMIAATVMKRQNNQKVMMIRITNTVVINSNQ